MLKTIVTPLLLAGAVALLSGCSMTLAVQGTTETGDETFTGTATGYMDGGGNLQIVTNKGTSCNGQFVYVTHREGRGTFVCNDGRSGPFEFVSTGSHGTGTGALNGRRFTFTFG